LRPLERVELKRQSGTNNLKRKRTRIQIAIFLSSCIMMLPGIHVMLARGAIEGQIRHSAPPWLSLFGAAVKPDGSIYIVGSKALLLTSTDHGRTWIEQTLKERPGSSLFQDRDLYSIRFAPDGKAAWIVGEEGTILYSNDGGRTWTKQQSGTTKNLFKVAVIDAQTAAAVGADGTILHTSDAGAHWQSAKSPKDITLFDVAFTDKNTGWVVGEFSTILTTKDGGQTWTVAVGGNTTDFTIGPFFTISFSDPQHAVAAGLAGELSVTDDGGKTWKPAKLPDEVGTYVLAEDTASKKLWVGGTGGKMLVQNPGGEWQEAPRTTFHDLTDMAFEGNQGVAVGLNGTILLTQNAGEQWQVVQ
jgi:photosystem II stability/assembly factor-like uncharacterized protein